MLNNTNASQAVEGPKVMAKIKKMSSAWRAVDGQVFKLRNRGAATHVVVDKKGTYTLFLCLRAPRPVPSEGIRE